MTKAELNATVPSNTFGKSLQKLKWPQILEIVHGLPEEILDKIYQAAEKKEDEQEQVQEQISEKKKAQGSGTVGVTEKKEKESNGVQQHIEHIVKGDSEAFADGDDEVQGHDHSRYLPLPSEEETKKCFCAFQSATSKRELMSYEGVYAKSDRQIFIIDSWFDLKATYKCHVKYQTLSICLQFLWIQFQDK